MTKHNVSKKKAEKAGKKSSKTKGKGGTTVSKHETNNAWRIRCTYYSRSYEAGIRKDAGGYKTEDQAKSEEALFAFAVSNGGAKNWVNWDPAETDAVIKKRNKAYFFYMLHACNHRRIISCHMRYILTHHFLASSHNRRFTHVVSLSFAI